MLRQRRNLGSAQGQALTRHRSNEAWQAASRAGVVACSRQISRRSWQNGHRPAACEGAAVKAAAKPKQPAASAAINDQDFMRTPFLRGANGPGGCGSDAGPRERGSVS
ncbi:hypothetical protein [Lysobacter gummosus]|uniref:hypothetical protein n=1 Tax=Lysobacter gummosus TaxID=262324 RepID=UPI003639A55B